MGLYKHRWNRIELLEFSDFTYFLGASTRCHTALPFGSTKAWHGTGGYCIVCAAHG